MATYFISDIHLQAASRANTELFLKFLRETASKADALYIIGDLFAVWFGDDLNQTYETSIIAALRELSAKNIPLYFMRGNRDFLISKQFCQAAGCTLLADPSLIKIYDQEYLVTHGDLLCTADHKYQKFRAFVQHPFIKAIFLSLPKFIRLKIGNWVKNTATSDNHQPADFNPEIYDVVPDTVEQWLNKYNTKFLIHGHTHKPAIHSHTQGQRIVLGDWTDKSAQVLCITAQGFRLENLI